MNAVSWTMGLGLHVAGLSTVSAQGEELQPASHTFLLLTHPAHPNITDVANSPLPSPLCLQGALSRSLPGSIFKADEIKHVFKNKYI